MTMVSSKFRHIKRRQFILSHCRIFKAHLIWPHLALDLFHWPGWIDDNATIPAVRYHRLSVSCRFPRRDIDCAPRDPIGLASDFGAVLFDDRLEFLVG